MSEYKLSSIKGKPVLQLSGDAFELIRVLLFYVVGEQEESPDSIVISDWTGKKFAYPTVKEVEILISILTGMISSSKKEGYVLFNGIAQIKDGLSKSVVSNRQVLSI